LEKKSKAIKKISMDIQELDKVPFSADERERQRERKGKTPFC